MKTVFLIPTVLAAALLDISAAAQMSSSNEPPKPSADIWEFTRRGEISPSLYTGTLQLSIPVFTYKDNDFEIPISLNYSTTGCLPNDRAGNLGVDWILDAGGTITREIRGVPDDITYSILETSISRVRIQGYAKTHEYPYESSYPGDLYCAGTDIINERFCYYYDIINEQAYDAEPDIFHFNFMGYSGTFHMDQNGKFHIYNTNEKTNPNGLKIEIDFAFNTVKSALAITTSDGFRYEFDGFRGHQDDNTEVSYGADYGTVILSWKLSRIIAPNGRTAEFEYEMDPNIQIYRPNTICFNVVVAGGGVDQLYGRTLVNTDGKGSSMSDIASPRLSGILVDGSKIADFNYEYNTENTYLKVHDENDQYYTKNGHFLLTGIDIMYDGQVIKTCRLQYDKNNQAAKGFLSSVDISGEGEFSMEYLNVDDIPVYCTFEIDHWGYFNGRPSTGENFLMVTSLDENMDETLISGNPRETHPEFVKCGTLQKITYPTGGYTTFEYEVNSYSEVMERKSDYDFWPRSAKRSGICGGVRIKKIRNYESDGTLLTGTEYDYHDSGILIHFPRYQFSFSTNLGNHYEFGKFWSNNLTRYSSTHIEYSDVTEKHLDCSMTHYRFSDSGNVQDVIDYLDYQPERIRTFGEWNRPEESYAHILMNTSMQERRGKLILKEDIDADGNVVNSEEYSYKNIRYAENIDFTYVPRYLVYATAYEAIYIGKEVISSSVGRRKYGTEEVKTKTDYGYNALYVPSSVTTTISGDEKHITRTTYLSNGESGINAEMYAKGFIETPVSEAEYVQYPGEDQKLVRRTSYTYLKPDADAHPDLYRIATATDYDPVSGVSAVTSYKYDSLGNLVEVTDPDGVSTAYIWGHGGLHLVAVVGNATIEQVEKADAPLPTTTGRPPLGVLPLSGIRQSPVSGALSTLQEDALRSIPGAEVTSYAWRPLVGLLSATDPSGRTVSYERNASGKLRRVLDPLSRPTAAWLYSPDDRLSQ